MKDIENRRFCNPIEISERIPQLNDRFNILGGDALTDVFGKKSYQKILSVLDGEQIRYVESLIDIISKKYHSVSALRLAFSRGENVTEQEDPDAPFDKMILMKIFYRISFS